MSIKMYARSVHDGVEMILPVESHTKCLQMWVYLNIEPTTIEFEVSTPLCDERVCGNSSSPPAFATFRLSKCLRNMRQRTKSRSE